MMVGVILVLLPFSFGSIPTSSIVGNTFSDNFSSGFSAWDGVLGSDVSKFSIINGELLYNSSTSGGWGYLNLIAPAGTTEATVNFKVRFGTQMVGSNVPPAILGIQTNSNWGIWILPDMELGRWGYQVMHDLQKEVWSGSGSSIIMVGTTYNVQVYVNAVSGQTILSVNGVTLASGTESYPAGTLSQFSLGVEESAFQSGVAPTAEFYFDDYALTINSANPPPPPPPPSLSASITPSSVALLIDESQQFTASVSGGTSPYTITWIRASDQSTLGTGTTYTFTASTSGITVIYAQVTDSSSATANSNNAIITVNSAPPPPPPPTGDTSTLLIQSTSGGTINPSAGTYTYNLTDTTTLTATPNSGYKFEYWLFSDGTTQTATTIQLLMSNSYSVTAVFSEETSPPPPPTTPQVTTAQLVQGVGMAMVLVGAVMYVKKY